MRGEPKIILAGILVFEVTGGIAETIFQRKIKIAFLILCMYHTNELFCLTTQYIRQFCIRPRGLVQLCIFKREVVHIVLMKTCIKPGFHNRIEKKGLGRGAIITQVMVIIGQWKPGCKIINGRINRAKA